MTTKEEANEPHVIPESPTPISDAAHGVAQMRAYEPSSNSDASQTEAESTAGGQDALMDLAQLEELHKEAERMKALGNKHMAAQGMSHRFSF